MPPTMLDDRSGPDDAFRIFYTTYLLTVFGILGRIGVRAADVQDIAQQVFLKIYRNFDKVPAERVISWIQMICEQQAAEHYRLYRNRFETPEANAGEELPYDDDVHARLEECEMAAIVQQVLGGMETTLREVLVRHEFQNESMESIANSLGIVRNTAYARLVEAKRIFGLRIKRRLGEDRGNAMLLLPFGAEAFRAAELQSPAFIEKMHVQVWQGIARELGWDESAIGRTTSCASEPPPPLSRRERKPFYQKMIDNRGLLVGTSVVAGFVAALHWPRETPMIAKTASMTFPVITINTSGAMEAEPKPAAHSTATTPAPQKTRVSTPVSDRETATLDHARELLANERFTEALAALAQHEKEFPQSQYVATRNRYIALAREGQKQAEIKAP